MTDLSGLEDRLGYRFKDRRLIERALTHASLTHEVSNQRLEFLGDVVLQLCVSDRLYHMEAKEDEGSLTRRRQQLVCEKALSKVAEGLRLGRFLRMQPELVRAGGRENRALLADAMEAVIAAVYLDGGMAAARQLVERLWERLFDKTDAALDAKGALQAHLQAQGCQQPEYKLISQDGPPHQRRFEAAVIASGRELARAWGDTIKEAQQRAAEIGLNTLIREETDETNPA
ncbi:MAG: ribonuclease III [Christensenellales bacterium]|jgi:ribonuclease-3